MNAVLLSGGFGSRLRPLTLSQPKAILPLLNKPFCLYPLEWLSHHGVRNVTFATGYRSRNLAALLAKKKPRGMTVLSRVERRPLGTAGALRHASAKARERFFVLNGDILAAFDLSQMLDFHLKKRALLTLALVKVPDVSRYGSVVLAGNGLIEQFTEKRAGRKRSGLVNAGIYLVEPEVVQLIPSTIPCSLERDVFPRLARERRGIFGYPIHGYWKDVGTLQSYWEAHRDLLTRKHLRRLHGQSFSKPIIIGTGTRLARTVRLEGVVSIGRNCRIERGARIKDSVLLDHVSVGHNAVIERSLISYHCRIGAHAQLGSGTVLGDRSQIPDYSLC